MFWLGDIQHHVFIVFCALLLDGCFGDPTWFGHPVRIIGKYISTFERLIRLLTLTSRGLRIAGILLTCTTVLLAALLSGLLVILTARLHPWIGIVCEIYLAYTCLAARCLATEASRIVVALKQGDLVRARLLLSYVVSRDTNQLDEGGILRATVETVAENTSDGVVAPMIFLLLGGVPLGFAYKAASTLDSMVGYKNEAYFDFGWASARFDDLLNLVPARLTAWGIIATAPFVSGRFLNGVRIWLRDAGKHASPNAGHPEAAVAGVLDIQLGGTSYYFGKVSEKPTLGDAARMIECSDVNKTIKLMYGSVIWTLGCLSFLIFAFSCSR